MTPIGKKILKKPVTREELLKVFEVFERQTDEKIRHATRPWYVKLWRSIRGKRPTARRQNRPPPRGVEGSETRHSGPARGK